MAGESRFAQIFFLIFCVVTSANFVHATGWFNSSTYSTTDFQSMSVVVTEQGGTGIGDVLNSVAYGAGGGIWLLVNFLFNYACPYFMIVDMGVHALIAGLLTLFYYPLMVIGGIEILSGREILR